MIWGVDVKHYKQIIINLLVEDECDDQKIEELNKQIELFVEEKAQTSILEIKEISTRVNL